MPSTSTTMEPPPSTISAVTISEPAPSSIVVTIPNPVPPSPPVSLPAAVGGVLGVAAVSLLAWWRIRKAEENDD